MTVISEVKILVGILRGELGGYREWDTIKAGSTYTMGAKNVAVTVSAVRDTLSHNSNDELIAI